MDPNEFRIENIEQRFGGEDALFGQTVKWRIPRNGDFRQPQRYIEIVLPSIDDEMMRDEMMRDEMMRENRNKRWTEATQFVLCWIAAENTDLAALNYDCVMQICNKILDK